MEKLEPKHIIAYLNHKLEVIHEGHIKEVHGFMNEEVFIDYNGIGTDMNGKELFEITPLLLPLSAITEPLEDGSVPIVELAKMAFGEIDVLDTTQKDGLYAVKFIDEEDDTTVFSYNTNVCSFQADYMNMEELERRITIVPRQLQLFEYLYSKHFDIHNRIPAGLAIDKRTVK